MIGSEARINDLRSYSHRHIDCLTGASSRDRDVPVARCTASDTDWIHGDHNIGINLRSGYAARRRKCQPIVIGAGLFCGAYRKMGWYRS